MSRFSLRVLCLFLLQLFVAVSSSASEPPWLTPIAVLVPADCPEHQGNRAARSNSAVLPSGERAYFETKASTAGKACSRSVDLVVSARGNAKRVTLLSIEEPVPAYAHVDLDSPDHARSFALIDSSPAGKWLLLEMDGTDSWRNNTYRDVQVGVVSVANPETPAWKNVWDLMGWRDCDASVQAQGFDGDRSVLRVRPSIWGSHPLRNCVAGPELWRVNLDSSTASRLADNAAFKRNAKQSGVDWVECKADPDIVAACYVTHGRLFFANGTPSLRIWKVGTHRILGVRTETAPANVEIDGFSEDVYGDYEVCPFTKDKPGEMQMVCIESASHLVHRRFDP